MDLQFSANVNKILDISQMNQPKHIFGKGPHLNLGYLLGLTAKNRLVLKQVHISYNSGVVQVKLNIALLCEKLGI